MSLRRRVLGALLLLPPSVAVAAPLQTLSVARAIFREFPLAAASRPASIAVALDGEIWFTESGANKIGRISRNGELTEYPIPTPNSGPLGITTTTITRSTALSDAWFTEFDANKIGRITRDGAVTEFPIPTPASGPVGITGEISDDAVWFTEFNANKLGRLSFDGVVTEFALPTPDCGPMGISRGPYGSDVWFTEFRANKIGWMFRNEGTVHEIAVPTPDAGPSDIVLSFGGGLVFTESNANRVGRIKVRLDDMLVEEFTLPAAGSSPSSIAARQDGSVWFTERRANKIGMIDAAGAVTEYAIRTPGGEPTGIAAEAWHVWFTDKASGRIVRLTRDAVVLVGAGVSGTWGTDFRFANPDASAQNVYIGASLEPYGVCTNSCPETRFDLAAHGSGSVRAFGSLLFPDLRTLYSRGSSSESPPTVTARVFNTARPGQGIVIPTIFLSSLTEANPSVLAFPSASRGPGVHSNLVLAEVSVDDEITVRVEAFSPDGDLLGGRSFRIERGTTVFLVDVLAQLGVAEVDGGQIRVTRTGGTGLMWGLLATLSDDGGVTVSPGLNS